MTCLLGEFMTSTSAPFRYVTKLVQYWYFYSYVRERLLSLMTGSSLS